MKDLVMVAKALKSARLVAFPTETVYGLGVDAENEAAVERMYSIKGRPANHPVIVHISSQDLVSYWAREIPDYAKKLMAKFWPGPMTLLLKRTEKAKDFITGGQDVVGLRIPSNEIAQTLLREFEAQGGHGVAAPSANRFGSISPTTSQDVKDELGAYLGPDDIIIDGGPCEVGVESTIIDCTGKLPRILRLGAVTEAMISGISPIDKDDNLSEIRVSGSLSRHYSPRAKVVYRRSPAGGEGFIALSSLATPEGVVRLAAPESIEGFARTLYGALRSGDTKGLRVIVVEMPEGEGLAAAIRDRISRASAE